MEEKNYQIDTNGAHLHIHWVFFTFPFFTYINRNIWYVQSAHGDPIFSFFHFGKISPSFFRSLKTLFCTLLLRLIKFRKRKMQTN